MANVSGAHIDDLAQAYALGALEPGECEQIEAHIVECTACPPSIERAQAVAALLAITAQQSDPPAGHEARFMARLAAEWRANPGAPAVKSRPADPLVRLARALSQAMRSPARQVAPLAAAAVLLTGFGVW